MDRFWEELSLSAEANPVHVADGAGSRDEQLRRRAFVVMSVWSMVNLLRSYTSLHTLHIAI